MSKLQLQEKKIPNPQAAYNNARVINTGTVSREKERVQEKKLFSATRSVVRERHKRRKNKKKKKKESLGEHMHISNVDCAVSMTLARVFLC